VENEESVQTDPVEAAVSRWLTLPEVADELGVNIIRVRQLYTDRQFLARRRGERDVLSVPAEFFQAGAVLKGLPGTLTLLLDAGYSDEESLVWLFADDGLPGSPVDALRANRGTEVRRRAQALGF
jgi:hypothetical protein